MKYHLRRYAAGGYRGASMYGNPVKALCGASGGGPVEGGVDRFFVTDPDAVTCKACRANNDYVVYKAGYRAGQKETDT